MLWQFVVAMTVVRDRLAAAWRSEEGSTAETVILTAVFAALAIAVGIIIVAKITAKANSIDLN